MHAVRHYTFSVFTCQQSSNCTGVRWKRQQKDTWVWSIMHLQRVKSVCGRLVRALSRICDVTWVWKYAGLNWYLQRFHCVNSLVQNMSFQDVARKLIHDMMAPFTKFLRHFECSCAQHHSFSSLVHIYIGIFKKHFFQPLVSIKSSYKSTLF